jgi:hypothetical protein
MDSTDTLLTATKSVIAITEASNDGLHVIDTASCNAAHRQHRSAVVARLLLSVVAVPLWTSLHQYGAGATQAVAYLCCCCSVKLTVSTCTLETVQREDARYKRWCGSSRKMSLSSVAVTTAAHASSTCYNSDQLWHAAY